MLADAGQTRSRAPGRRRGLSIFQKMLALILLLVAGIVALLAVYLPSRQVSALEIALEAKARTYARLASKQLAPAVAFDDKETAREIFEALAEDADVEALVLLDARGTLLGARGAAEFQPSELKGPATSELLRATTQRVRVVSPVVSLEGPRGTLVVELSRRGLLDQQRRVRSDAVLVGLAALLLGGVGASLIAISFRRRLRAISRVAEAVAAGNLEQPPLVDAERPDEIGVVAVAFNAMLAHIRELVAQIRRSALEEQRRLEGLVAERTHDLDERNADLKRLLDNVGQGFVSLDRAGRMSRERSRVLGEWFGPDPDSGLFADLLANTDADKGSWFAVGWESLQDGIMPAEVSLQQLPGRINAGARELGLEYRALLGADGEVERVLVVVSDVTDEIRRSRAEADEREITGLFSRLIADRTGLLEFFWEAHQLLEQAALGVRTRELVSLKRALHTLKGNASLYGLETVAEICHGLEDKLEEATLLQESELEPLRRRWLDVSSKVRALVEDRSGKIEIDDAEYAEILAAIERGVGHAELRRRVQAWRLEPAEARLTRIGEQAAALAERLGKGPIEVRIEANQIRVERERWAEFWSACVHIVRNSVDHGLEPGEERDLLGKRLPALLELSTAIVGDRFQIEFSDDGRGIDWEAVRGKARELGLPSESSEELIDALFSDGLSTKSEVSEVSGRGVGLGAVRQVCTRLAGKVEVTSSRGAGTTVRFSWPAAVAFAPASPRSPLAVRPLSPLATLAGARS
jgi:two-component system, chemotaxis family, sensor kinase CheA